MNDQPEPLPVELLVKSDSRRSRETDRLLTDENVDLLWPMDFSDIQPAQARPAREVSKVLQILDALQMESESESEEPN
jgi:hypothetical protein